MQQIIHKIIAVLNFLRRRWLIAVDLLLSGLRARGRPDEPQFLPRAATSRARFGNDAAWYERTIPFFAWADSTLESVAFCQHNVRWPPLLRQ